MAISAELARDARSGSLLHRMGKLWLSQTIVADGRLYCGYEQTYRGDEYRCGSVGLLADDKQPKKLTDAELEKLLKDEKNLFFLDVREPKEIQELGSIKGYVNIPMGQLESRLSEIPKDKLIITA